MTARNVSIDLGEGDEKLTITLCGKPCLVADAQMAVTKFLIDYRKATEERIAKGELKPCGCKEKE